MSKYKRRAEIMKKQIIQFSDDGKYLVFRRSEYIYKSGEYDNEADRELGYSDGDICMKLPVYMCRDNEDVTSKRSDKKGLTKIMEWINEQLD